MDLLKNQQQPETKLHFLDYWRIIRIRKAIIITVFLITAIIATAVTFILPPSYASTAEIEIEPDYVQDINPDGQGTYAGYDPYFIKTELAVMQDQQVLGKVVEALNLNEVWGKKYANGETFKTSETIEFLKRRISLSPVLNTKLIDITVYGEDPNEAASIANAVADAYRDYRLDQEKQKIMGGIKVMQDNYDDEELKLQAMQAKVDMLRTNLGVIETDPTSLTPTPILSAEQVQRYHDLMIDDQAHYTELATQMAELKKLDPDKLRDVLPGVNNGDSELSSELDKLHESELRYVTLTNTDGMENPDVITLQAQIAELNREIDDRVSGIMTTLEDNVESEKAKLDALVEQVEAAKQEDMEETSRSAHAIGSQAQSCKSG